MTVVVCSPSQSQKRQQSQGLGVCKAPSSRLLSLLDSDSVYKMPNMPQLQECATVWFDVDFGIRTYEISHHE